MKVYNTLSGKKEEFIPRGHPVRMYVCGVTPYDECHVGHAMSYIIFDVIRRYLEFRGYQVRHVQNFTDIDDKIIARANRLGIAPDALAEKYISQYFIDMDALNIQRAHIYPRATQEIPKIIEIVQSLMSKGYAYQIGSDVYFRVKSLPDYGKLSRRTLEGMMSGARIEASEQKEHPMDFTLWKGAKPGEPQWESPWGMGRPGWHIECSAMSIKYLGESLDIHGGGQDLIFPHHENEIAQSESFTGVSPFVHYWIHNGLMQMGEEKMSKSLGNLVTVKEAISRYGADALRLFVLGSGHSSPLTYSEESLLAMRRGVERLIRAATAKGSQSGKLLNADPLRQKFMEAMDDDFNTALASAALFDLAKEINRGVEEGQNVKEAQSVLMELTGVMGLTLREEVELSKDAAPFIELLIGTRAELRKAKEWALADRIRERLEEMGVVLEDAPNGTTWKYVSEAKQDIKR
ncbi:MAG: cysteine--tRNA ligase [Chloroflexi bacterium]|nr:cysteine--tRNA ligase [Chloroflexota bacterium]